LGPNTNRKMKKESSQEGLRFEEGTAMGDSVLQPTTASKTFLNLSSLRNDHSPFRGSSASLLPSVNRPLTGVGRGRSLPRDIDLFFAYRQRERDYASKAVDATCVYPWIADAYGDESMTPRGVTPRALGGGAKTPREHQVLTPRDPTEEDVHFVLRDPKGYEAWAQEMANKLHMDGRHKKSPSPSSMEDTGRKKTPR